MKFTKMSLVATLLASSSVFAIDNVKVSGDANLFYSTIDGTSAYTKSQNKKGGSLFSKDSSAADASVNLNVTADLFKNDMVTLSAGAGYTVLSTLGLENNLVSQVWGTSHGAVAGTKSQYASNLGGARVTTANWMTEAWIAATAGKTTAKIGRMELDTPLAFTDKSSIEKNTFEAAVLINQDIPDTTLVGAYVGNGNGNETFGQDTNGTVAALNLAVSGVVNENGTFNTFGKDGAYAVGIINNSFKPLTVQGWYYNVMNVADAYWLQADLKCQLIPGLLAGAQYSSMKADVAGAQSDDVYALMLGYDAKVVTIKGAYSSVNNDGTIGATGFNTATDTGRSKLYTEAWWNYGYVVLADTDSYNVSVEGNVADTNLGAHYTRAKTSQPDNENTMKEFALTASRTYGPLDATLAYVYTKSDDQNDNTNDNVNNGEAYNMIQAYLTLNF